MRTVRFEPRCVRAAVLALCVLVATPAFAQEAAVPSGLAPVDFRITAADLRAQAPRPVLDGAQVRPIVAEQPRRPAALLPLYGSLIALQGMDYHSTQRALDAGRREANPAMRGVVNNSAAFFAVKAGATAGVIWASEKMWKKNRKGAVIFAVVVNAAMAAVVANNYRVRR